MNPWRWVDPRVSEVRLDGVRAYLTQRGYLEKPEANPNLIRFEIAAGRNGGSTQYHILPASEKLADFVSSVTYFLTTLSEQEGRHPVAILDEILQLQTSESLVGSR